VSLSLLSQALMAAEEGGEFEAPTVEHSFFFDKIGDGSVIASVKAMVLLVLGVILVMAFFLAASRKASMMPSKLQFAGESAYGFVRNGVAIEILGGHYGRKWAGFLTTLFAFILIQNLWGIVPLAQLPVTSHFAIPVLLAVMGDPIRRLKASPSSQRLIGNRLRGAARIQTLLFRQRLVDQGIDERPIAHSLLKPGHLDHEDRR